MSHKTDGSYEVIRCANGRQHYEMATWFYYDEPPDESGHLIGLPHRLDFEVRECWVDDDKVLYQLESAPAHPHYTPHREQADIFCDGTIDFSGCMNISLHDYHFCKREGAAALTEITNWLFDQAEDWTA